MLGCDGKPSKNSLASFISDATGKSYEEALRDLTFPIGVDLNKNITIGFDFKDLVKESTLNPMGKPSKAQVTDFLVKETGSSYESAFTKLSMIRLKKVW